MNLNVPNLTQFLEGTLGWILGAAENDLQRNSAVHLVSVLINRKAEGREAQNTSTLALFNLLARFPRTIRVPGVSFYEVLVPGDREPTRGIGTTSLGDYVVDMGLFYLFQSRTPTLTCNR